MNPLQRSNRERDWVFVTGVPRSGTTFVGTTLSSPLAVDYLHEPFSPEVGICGANWYGPIQFDEQGHPTNTDILDAISRLRRYRVRLQRRVPANDPPRLRWLKRLVGGRGPLNLAVAKANPLSRSAVIKCPRGWFMLRYLVDTLPLRAVVVVKHPVSLAASLLRAGWQTRPERFKEFRGLERLLTEEDRQRLEDDWSDPYLAAALQWRFTYLPLLKWSEDDPRVRWVTIEQVSDQPLERFAELFQWTGLPFSPAVQRRIRRNTEAGNAEARQGRFQDLKRDSRRIFAMRRQAVPVEKRRMIYDLTHDVASRWYSEESYDL